MTDKSPPDDICDDEEDCVGGSGSGDGGGVTRGDHIIGPDDNPYPKAPTGGTSTGPDTSDAENDIYLPQSGGDSESFSSRTRYDLYFCPPPIVDNRLANISINGDQKSMSIERNGFDAAAIKVAS